MINIVNLVPAMYKIRHAKTRRINLQIACRNKQAPEKLTNECLSRGLGKYTSKSSLHSSLSNKCYEIMLKPLRIQNEKVDNK